MTTHLKRDATTGHLVYGSGGHLVHTCAPMYKLTPCVAPIYELDPCTEPPYCIDPCDQLIIGFAIEFEGITDRVCECYGDDGCRGYGCPDANTHRRCGNCFCSGTDNKSSLINGIHELYYNFEDICTFSNQPALINNATGVFITISKGSLLARYCPSGDGYCCGYFEAKWPAITSGNCWPSSFVKANNSHNLTDGILRGGENGTATITPIYRDPGKCPPDPGGSIYIQDEDTKFSGTECYTEDDLSEYVGKHIQRQEDGAWYYVSLGHGSPVVSVTVADSAESCPIDKYAQYAGMAVTIEVGEDILCFYLSLGGTESDGEVTILDSYDTCNECCGEAA